ncbi:MAG: YebC/PmpR family DNA-binding transcriptional regulator [Planctomycetota bacterium]|jgi:YebC/PmpR family DNA-binding regulatory protein
MAGHSHFANIMRVKARMDARRGKVFSKISRLIQAAVRQGGPNLRDNLRLQYAVDKAKAANMPKDTIQRIIDKASGAAGGDAFEEVTYEAYGPGGIAILIEALTDNRNRTAPEVRIILDRNGGSVGTSGSVSWMFERKGEFDIPSHLVTEERLYELVIDAGAEDITREGEGTDDARFVVTCPAGAFEEVKAALADAQIEPSRAEFVMSPSTTVDADEDTARKIMRIQALLEDNDDVQTVNTNLDVSEDVAEKLARE